MRENYSKDITSYITASLGLFEVIKLFPFVLHRQTKEHSWKSHAAEGVGSPQVTGESLVTFGWFLEHHKEFIACYMQIRDMITNLHSKNVLHHRPEVANFSVIVGGKFLSRKYSTLMKHEWLAWCHQTNSTHGRDLGTCTCDHGAVLLHSNNMLMILVISLVAVLFVPICAGKTNNIIGMYMYMYRASLASRSLNGGEIT